MPSAIQRLRRQAYHRQDRRCCYCAVPMWLLEPEELPSKPPSPAAALRIRCTAEHLVPKSDGGRDVEGNVAAACLHCNLTRHRRKIPLAPEAFRRMVGARVSRGAWHQPWVHEQGLLERRLQTHATSGVQPPPRAKASIAPTPLSSSSITVSAWTRPLMSTPLLFNSSHRLFATTRSVMTPIVMWGT